MNAVERIAFAIRHNQYLDRTDRLWNCVRPTYDRLSSLTARKGLTRVINGTDSVLVSPRWRMVAEEYEPEVWRHLMSAVRPGDVVADVGAYIGLYTIALAKRVGSAGSVIAFEPNPASFNALREHLVLNSISDSVRLVQAAVGASEGRAPFEMRWDQSHINRAALGDSPDSVTCITLDGVIGDGHVDVMKIDVEGYEEKVLEGAVGLLSDPARRPRAIYIEVHPHLWEPFGTTSDSLQTLLSECNYRLLDLSGGTINRISEYGEIVAVETLMNAARS